MKEVVIYLVHTNCLLLLFFALYKVVLAKDTLFTAKRFFLLGAVVVSFIAPLLPPLFTFDLPTISNITNKQAGLGFLITESSTTLPTTTLSIQAISIVGWTTLLVSALLVVRMLIAIISVLFLAQTGNRVSIQGEKIILTKENNSPFSFFGWIFIPQDIDNECLTEVLTHESTHRNAYHYIDTIISELLCAFCWINPIAWLMREEIRINLEFLADYKVIKTGVDPKKYQYHLLRFACQAPINNLSNNFNISHLKKRIMMMNQKETSKKGVIKYIFIFSLMAGGSLLNAADTTPTTLPMATNLTQEKDSVGIKVTLVDGAEFDVKTTEDGSVIITSKEGSTDKKIKITEKDVGKISEIVVTKKAEAPTGEKVKVVGYKATEVVSVKKDDSEELHSVKKAEVISSEKKIEKE